MKLKVPGELTVGDESTNRVEQLPEGHFQIVSHGHIVMERISKLTNFATDLGRCNFSNENRPGGESHTLAYTNEDSAEDKDTNFMTRSESLDDGCDDSNEAADPHTPSSTKVVGLYHNQYMFCKWQGIWAKL
jgi:hypothetical protein